MGTQVSGSISLDLHKVVREVIQGTVDELVRSEPTAMEREHGAPVPLQKIADQVATVVARLTSSDLLRIERKVDALTVLVRAEAERRDRVQVQAEPAVICVRSNAEVYDQQYRDLAHQEGQEAGLQSYGPYQHDDAPSPEGGR